MIVGDGENDAVSNVLLCDPGLTQTGQLAEEVLPTRFRGRAWPAEKEGSRLKEGISLGFDMSGKLFLPRFVGAESFQSQKVGQHVQCPVGPGPLGRPGNAAENPAFSDLQ